MTKKHFIALADAIREHNRQYSQLQWLKKPEDEFTEKHLCTLADFCASQNSQFNRERWLGYIALIRLYVQVLRTNGKNGGKVK